MIRINLISEGKKSSAVRSTRLRAFNVNTQNIATFCVIVTFLLAVAGYGGYWLYMNRQVTATTIPGRIQGMTTSARASQRPGKRR